MTNAGDSLTGPGGPLAGVRLDSGFTRASGFELASCTALEVTGHLEADESHHTPWGVVHGGVYTTIVETACSLGASVAVADRGQHAVGLSNHTDFVRAHRTGPLDVRAYPIHQGRTGQLWQCDITRADGKLVAQGRVRLQNVDQL
jgi:1,4-dihydroxy-2-naphthoyl-CoA hydrolase